MVRFAQVQTLKPEPVEKQKMGKFMSGRSFNSQGSKTSFFFKSLVSSRCRYEERIRLPGLPVVAEEIKPKKILIIDDDAVILKTLSLKLEGAGYEVVTATDGADAIGAMREEKPDMILVDVHFPPDIGGGVPWDGFILTKWLAAMERSRRVPVILITGSVGDGFRDKALASGALGLFEKPIDHAKLIVLVKKAFAGQAVADTNYEI